MKISVIVANYNYGKYISRTIHSLVNQSLPRSEYEIIVADDGSTDNTKGALEPYWGEIKFIALPHMGQSYACNEGFRQAEGQYVVRVDSDDYINSKLLELESLFLEENKDFDAVSCDYYKVDDKGNRLSRCSPVIEPIACGVMLRRDSLFDTGIYSENITLWEEKEFMGRFLAKYKVYNIPLPLYRYLQHNDSLTHRGAECS